MSIPSFDEAVRLLQDRVNFEHLQTFAQQDMEGRLEPLRQVLALLGNPETAYRTVHIAGTKGKGSTCVMLESILRKSGLRVGRFTSPHLYCFTERLKIDEKPILPGEFTDLIFDVSRQIAPAIFQSFTYFELLTLLAFVYFFRKKVDVAIFEVGLGGRLDATNLCCPDVSVITSISYDHMAQLGTTLAEIAAEKSGIIKTGVPAVTTVLHPEPLRVIREKAESVDAPLYVLNEHFFVRQTTPQYTFRYESRLPMFPAELILDGLSLKMPGKHQIYNAAAAVSAFLLAQKHKEHKEEYKQPLCYSCLSKKNKIRTALQNAYLPLRIEIIRRSEDSPTFIFDGAHNRASMRGLVKTATELFPNHRLILIFGTSLDKDVEGMFAEINGHFDHVFLTQSSSSSRRFPPQELRSFFALPDSRVSIVENCKDVWERCRQMANSGDVLCIAGSLFLAAELRESVKN